MHKDKVTAPNRCCLLYKLHCDRLTERGHKDDSRQLRKLAFEQLNDEHVIDSKDHTALLNGRNWLPKAAHHWAAGHVQGGTDIDSPGLEPVAHDEEGAPVCERIGVVLDCAILLIVIEVLLHLHLLASNLKRGLLPNVSVDQNMLMDLKRKGKDFNNGFNEKTKMP